MDLVKQVAELERLHAKAIAIQQLVQTPQFKEYLLPELKQLSTIRPIDPITHKSKEDYLYTLSITNAEANAIDKFMKYLLNQEHLVQVYSKQLYTLKLQNEAATTKRIE